jgi:hypothetical protein
MVELLSITFKRLLLLDRFKARMGHTSRPQMLYNLEEMIDTHDG